VSSSEFHANLKAKGSGAKDWTNSWTNIEYLGGGKFAATISVGHKVFKDREDGQWKRRKVRDERSVNDCILVQSARCCVEVHPYYAKFFDVNHEEVRLHEERWVVQRLFKGSNNWRDVDAYNPVLSVEDSENDVTVTISYTTDYGSLTVKYIQKDGLSLKHEIIFTNTSGGIETFRVLQRWAGIVGDRCNSKNFPLDTSEPFLAFHRADESPASFTIVENLHTMIFNSDGSKMTEKCLLGPVKIERHAQGMKADFIYGNWILAKDENLAIDPDTATLNNPTQDGGIIFDSPNYSRNYTGTSFSIGAAGGNIYRGYVEWDVTGISDSAEITDTVFKYEGYTRNIDCHIHEMLGTRPSTSSDSAVYSQAGSGTVYADPVGFPIPGKTRSADLGATADAELEASLVTPNWFAIGMQSDNEGTAAISSIRAEEYAATPDPTLYVEYTVSVVVPTVTTQAADDLGIGVGTLNGNITATGGENADERGFDWDYDTGVPYAYEETDLGDFGVGAFEEALSGLTEGNTVYFRGKANNSAGWGYGGEESFVVRKAIEKSASGAVGLVGATGRALVAERLGSGAIEAVGVLSRSFIGVRSGAGSLGVAATGELLRAFFRLASGTIGMIGTTARGLVITRSASSAIGITGNSARSWVGVRAAAGSLGVAAAGELFRAFFRLASAAMGLVGSTARAVVFTRSALGAMTAQAATTRVYDGLRLAAASISTAATSGRDLMIMRAQSASMGLAATSGRIYAGIRGIAASVGVAANGWFLSPIIGGIVRLRFAGKTALLELASKEAKLNLSLKNGALELADKIKRLMFGRKEN